MGPTGWDPLHVDQLVLIKALLFELVEKVGWVHRLFEIIADLTGLRNLSGLAK
jgi:hypothetical protein